MFKFTTIYHKVDDEEKAEQFFSATHLALAEQLPNLVKREVSRIVRKPGGQSRYTLMFELYFADETALKEAIATPIGIQLIQALTPWAEAKIITWFFAEAFEELN
jgi:uncharacterized protein (TIGR02118 family)